MSLSSSFRDFSLAELFQLVDQGRKSGCLTVCTLPSAEVADSKTHYYYIWFREGRIVAAAHRLDGKGLVSKLTERGWLNQHSQGKLSPPASTGKPLGLNLKTEGVLTSEQLNLLFASQLYQVRDLFEIYKGIFKLDSKAALPWNEMTGLTLGALEVALMALRALKNWQVLADVIPEPDCGVQSLTNIPQMRLHAFEQQVWERASGISLEAIALQMNEPTIKVQQAAFRLRLAGLVEEVPLLTSMPVGSQTATVLKPVQSQIGMSFLQNLVGFLRSKA